MASKKLKKVPTTIGSVRRSQLVTTYGVGSVIPIESESFIVAGLESWRPKDSDIIEEPRLCSALGVRQLHTPPAGEFGSVPLVRFPEWVHCPNCHRLAQHWKLAAKDGEKTTNRCHHCLTSTLVPSRFVSCCEEGHIQDFPFHYWIHGSEGREGRHDLRLLTNPSNSSLAGITVECSCGRRRSMEGALGGADGNSRCQGRSPWLDRESVTCSARSVGLQRGASNVWFADVRSALTIDRSESPAETILRKRLWPAVENMDIPTAETFLRSSAPAFSVSEEDLVNAYRARISPESVTFDDLRREEYEALGRPHLEDEGHSFSCSPFSVEGSDPLGRVIATVSRVSRLREVRALRGFSRVKPRMDSASAAGELSREKPAWMPAIEVLGEGVFVDLNKETVQEWCETDFADDRATKLTAAIRAAADDSETAAIPPRKLLLHSLAHALLNELALTSGYPASSIRERVYDSDQQCGILLYTATADAAGSLGGLCAHGDVETIRHLIRSTAERAQWCSADPVCLETTSSGAGAVNLAACHSCMLAPEVSCEHQNRYLDRACLVGTAERPDAGFFNHL